MSLGSARLFRQARFARLGRTLIRASQFAFYPVSHENCSISPSTAIDAQIRPAEPSTNRFASCADFRSIEGVQLAFPVRSLPLPLLKIRERAQGHDHLAISQTEDRQFEGRSA